MKLKARKRDILGKKVKNLRRRGLLPAVVFGKEVGSIPVTLDKSEFKKVFAEAGESALVDVELNGQKPQKVLVSEVDTDPVTDEILHANLHAVSLSDKITAQVPIKIVGESPIVKAGEGLILTILDELEVECLPQDLPPEIAVDISNLTEIDQTITIKDIKIDPEKIALKHEPDDVVLKVEHAKMQEVEEEEEKEEVPVEEAVEITMEKKEEGITESTEETEGTEAKKTARERS